MTAEQEKLIERAVAALERIAERLDDFDEMGIAVEVKSKDLRALSKCVTAITSSPGATEHAINTWDNSR